MDSQEFEEAGKSLSRFAEYINRNMPEGYVRKRSGEEYGRQLNALLSLDAVKNASSRTPQFDIQLDDFGTHNITWTAKHQNSFRVANTSAYPWKMTVSSQGRIRLLNDDRGPYTDPNSPLENFDEKEYRHRLMVEAVINRLQKAVVIMLAAQDKVQFDLESPTGDIKTKIKYFTQACNLYPDAMKNAHISLGPLKDSGSIVEAARKAGLFSLTSRVKRLIKEDVKLSQKLPLKSGLYLYGASLAYAFLQDTDYPSIGDLVDLYNPDPAMKKW